jgi:hypothetical protein
MLRKLFGAATVGLSVVAMALPAGAATQDRHAKLKNVATHKTAGTAKLAGLDANGVFEDVSVTIPAGSLPKGNYYYEVDFENVKLAEGRTSGGDVVCTFRVRNVHKDATCHGTIATINNEGKVGAKNYAKVGVQGNPYPVLMGTLVR